MSGPVVEGHSPVLSTTSGRSGGPPADCGTTARACRSCRRPRRRPATDTAAPPDLDEQLVQMPGVALAAPAVPQPPCVAEPERPTPLPNGLIRHRDTPFGEEILDISETQAETMSRPGESHPQPLVERYVNLSTHTAPIRRTTCRLTHGCVFIRISSWTIQLDTDKTTRRRPFAPSPLQRLPHYYERLRPSASHRYSGSCAVTT